MDLGEEQLKPVVCSSERSKSLFKRTAKQNHFTRVLIVVNHLRVHANVSPHITYVGAPANLHTHESIDNTDNVARTVEKIYLRIYVVNVWAHTKAPKTKQNNRKNKWNYIFGVIFSSFFSRSLSTGGFSIIIVFIVLTVDLSVSFQFAAHICLPDSFECSIVYYSVCVRVCARALDNSGKKKNDK